MSILIIPMTHSVTPIHGIGEDGHTTSLFISSSSRNYHFQIDSSESRMIWDLPSDFGGYDQLIETDLNRDNGYEVVGLTDDDIYRSFNPITGEIIWEQRINVENNDNTDYTVGDFTGDGFHELFISRHIPTNESDEALVLINTLGEVLANFNSTIPEVEYHGADNVQIFDIDTDGKNELIISYGKVLFNDTGNISTSSGAFAIEIWEWNNNQPELQASRQGVELAANTEMVIYPSNENLIITAGTNNNPIRAFNEDLDLIWEKQLSNQESFNQPSPQLLLTKDNNGRDHLLVITNRNSTDSINSIYDLDPNEGTELNLAIELENSFHSIAGLMDNLGYFQTNKWSQNSENQIETHVELQTIEFFDDNEFTTIDHFDKEIKSVLSSNIIGEKELSIIDLGNPYILVQTADDLIWLVGQEDQVLIYDEPINGLTGNLVINEVAELNGDRLENYRSEKTSYLWLIIIVSVLSLFGFGIFILRRAVQFNQFHQQYEKNWKVNFYLRLNRIVLRLLREKRIFDDQLHLTSGKEVKLLGSGSKDSELIMYKEIKYPEMKDEIDVNRLKPFSGRLDEFREWLSKSRTTARKIKLGDLAIMLEVLENYPVDMILSDLVSKLDFASTSTLYSRVNFLIKSGFLEDSDNDLEKQAANLRKLKITQLGLELMTGLYLSLDYTIGEESGF